MELWCKQGSDTAKQGRLKSTLGTALRVEADYITLPCALSQVRNQRQHRISTEIPRGPMVWSLKAPSFERRVTSLSEIKKANPKHLTGCLKARFTEVPNICPNHWSYAYSMTQLDVFQSLKITMDEAVSVILSLTEVLSFDS